MKLHKKQAVRQKEVRRTDRRTGRIKLPRLIIPTPFTFPHLNALTATAAPWSAR